MGCYLTDLDVAEVFARFRGQLADALELDENLLYIVQNSDSRSASFEILIDYGKKRPLISIFDLIMMPGCCGIIISTGAFVYPPYRGKGVGTILNHFRKAIAAAMGFGVMLCTDVLQNEAQQKILEKNGWDQIYAFINPRTDNVVGIHVIQLEEPDGTFDSDYFKKDGVVYARRRSRGNNA